MTRFVCTDDISLADCRFEGMLCCLALVYRSQRIGNSSDFRVQRERERERERDSEGIGSLLVV